MLEKLSQVSGLLIKIFYKKAGESLDIGGWRQALGLTDKKANGFGFATFVLGDHVWIVGDNFFNNGNKFRLIGIAHRGQDFELIWYISSYVNFLIDDEAGKPRLI